jgi:aspartyl-tRNA(Asn)/glutamyl-tRNA(Gln) amidotransferase subunit A
MKGASGQLPPDAVGLVSGYISGAFSPVDVIAGCLQRIKSNDQKIGAFVCLNEPAAEEARASAARYAAGRPLGPLDGVPIAVKDNIAVRGLPATWGSPHYAGYIPETDELPVARLREGGLIVLGKTNVPEFTLEGYTSNRLFGVTGNPWDVSLTPGGSSGGSVAAVAAGFVPIAIGTDGGGSIRRPSAYTGLVGLKPSIGMIARGRGLPQVLLDFEVIGPVARTVGDLSLLFSVLAGPDRRDHRSRRFADTGRPERRPLRRILLVERFGDKPVDPVILRCVNAAADALGGLGLRIERGSLPFDIEPADTFWSIVAEIGLAALFDSDPRICETASAKYVEMAKRGAALPATTFLAGLEKVSRFRDQVGAAFEHVDMIMTPACAAMPWPAAEAWPRTIDGQEVGPRGHAIYTGWVNVCGHPAISLPAPPAPNGLPVGFQLIGELGSDEHLIDIARLYENSPAWVRGWPPGF